MIRDYKYVATDISGNTVKGSMEAPNKVILARFLSARGLVAKEITEYSNFFNKLSKIQLGKTIKTQELIFILKQLSAMLQAGLRLSDTLEVIATQTKDKIVRRIIFDIYFEVEAGRKMSDAMEKYPSDFPKLMRNMVKIGEENGDLVSSVDNLAQYFENQQQVKSDIIGALTLPVIYILMGIAVAAVMIVFVIPGYADLFATTGNTLPGPTRTLMNIGEFVNNNGLYLGFITALVLFLSYYLFGVNEKGKRVFSMLMIRMPIIGQVVIMYNLATISSTLSQLVENKVRIIEAVHSTTKIVKNAIYREILEEVVEDLKNGISITRAMDNHYAFTPVFTKMLNLGEKSGTLGPMLKNLADFSNTDVQVRTKRLKKTIEPTIMIMIYALVGYLVMAIMLPSLYSIGNI